MRTIAGIVFGYLIFAVPSYLLFRVTHHEPHVPASIGFEIVAIGYGIVFAFLGGYGGAVIAGRRDMKVPAAIAIILAALAILSMAMTGISWSPLSAVVLMAPAVLIGGYAYMRRKRA